jgi:hypothetical protein
MDTSGERYAFGARFRGFEPKPCHSRCVTFAE